MSLRLRLTTLFTIMVFGGLLTFGSLAYGLVSLTLLSQMDNELSEATDQIVSSLRINEQDELDLSSLNNQSRSEELVLQVWSNQGELIYTHPSVFQSPLTNGEILDATAIGTYSSIRGDLRVRSTPIRTSMRSVGVLIVARSLTLAESAEKQLFTIMVSLGLIAVPLSALATWVMNGEALKPLTEMTIMATSITKADDLHKRIDVKSRPDDETGQLIQAFNQTLERLENLFNSQNRFLADVSHELRTPLTVIKGNVGLMKRLGSGDEESLDSISSEVDRLTRLVGDLLLLAQAETGNLPLHIQVVEMDTLFLEVFQQMKILAGQKANLRIKDLDEVRVKGDPDRLKQVMVNLIANAIQHVPQSGEIEVSIGKKDGKCLFQVTDNGAGIAPEDLPFIFERFYRTEKSRQRAKDTGFGLGLSIVRWIVNKHDGTVEVESQVGEGSTFRVYLPLWDDPAKWDEID